MQRTKALGFRGSYCRTQDRAYRRGSKLNRGSPRSIAFRARVCLVCSRMSFVYTNGTRRWHTSQMQSKDKSRGRDHTSRVQQEAGHEPEPAEEDSNSIVVCPAHSHSPRHIPKRASILRGMILRLPPGTDSMIPRAPRPHH